MPKYTVLVPMAGHISVQVEADNEEQAIERAMESDDLNLDNLDNWETLDRFNQGNVCCCPSPWEAEAILENE